ncbi:Fatty acid 2-hydroxylase [Homalodisca vitripennis]|nr:Fatty acid 2-hydroxylase [Homalodisca vitripennis]
MPSNTEIPVCLQEQIDWSQSLVKQVGGLGERYHSWVVKPVDRRARLFDADWLEQLTVVQWYVIPLVWVPVYITLLYISHLRLVNVIDSQVTSRLDSCNLTPTLREGQLIVLRGVVHGTTRDNERQSADICRLKLQTQLVQGHQW